MFKPMAFAGGTVQALQLTPEIAVRKEPDTESTYAAYIPLYLDMFRVIHFQAPKTPEVGDWVVRDPGAPSFHVPADLLK